MDYIDTLENIENLFYTVLGAHCGDTLEKILKDKQTELENNDFSLWGAKIDEPSRKLVWDLDKNDKVYVFGKIGKNPTDPGKDGKIRAKIMKGPDEKKVKIPDAITTTYAVKKKHYQAFVVKEYKILDNSIKFDFGKYETKTSTNEIKSFNQKKSWVQNIFYKRNNKLKDYHIEDIAVIMELKYPFVVEIE